MEEEKDTSESPLGYDLTKDPHLQYSLNLDNILDIASLTTASIVNWNSTASFNWNTISTPPQYGNYQINPYASSVNYGFQSTAQLHPALQVNGKLEVKGESADIEIDGRSLKEFITKLEDRLAILQPIPEKLEKFEALKKAYEQYKLLESLCEIQDKKEE